MFLVNRQEFETLVDEALEEIPAEFLARIDNLVVVVEDRPTPDQDPDGDELLGLYEGVSLAEARDRLLRRHARPDHRVSRAAPFPRVEQA